jgi:hypothetical protein
VRSSAAATTKLFLVSTRQDGLDASNVVYGGPGKTRPCAAASVPGPTTPCARSIHVRSGLDCQNPCYGREVGRSERENAPRSAAQPRAGIMGSTPGSFARTRLIFMPHRRCYWALRISHLAGMPAISLDTSKHPTRLSRMLNWLVFDSPITEKTGSSSSNRHRSTTPWRPSPRYPISRGWGVCLKQDPHIS